MEFSDDTDDTLEELNEEHINNLEDNYMVSYYIEDTSDIDQASVDIDMYVSNEKMKIYSDTMLFFYRDNGFMKVDNRSTDIDSNLREKADTQSKGMLNEYLETGDIDLLEGSVSKLGELEKQEINHISDNHYEIKYDQGVLELFIDDSGLVEEQVFEGHVDILSEAEQVEVKIEYKVIEKEGVDITKPDWVPNNYR